MNKKLLEEARENLHAQELDLDPDFLISHWMKIKPWEQKYTKANERLTEMVNKQAPLKIVQKQQKKLKKYGEKVQCYRHKFVQELIFKI